MRLALGVFLVNVMLTNGIRKGLEELGSIDRRVVYWEPGNLTV
jgi:hypothetical protein